LISTSVPRMPSSFSHRRTLGRPTTTIGSPLLMDSATLPASRPKAATVYQLVLPEAHSPVCEFRHRGVEPSRRVVTSVPEGGVLRSGSVPAKPRTAIVSDMVLPDSTAIGSLLRCGPAVKLVTVSG